MSQNKKEIIGYVGFHPEEAPPKRITNHKGAAIQVLRSHLKDFKLDSDYNFLFRRGWVIRPVVGYLFGDSENG